MRKRLDSAKATMMLANQIYYQAIGTRRWESLEQDILGIRMSNGQHHDAFVREIVDLRSVVGHISKTMEADRLPTGCTIETRSSAGSAAKETEAASGSDEELGAATEFNEPPSGATFPGRKRQGRTLLVQQQGMKFLSGILDIVTANQGKITVTSVSVELPAWIWARRFEIHLLKSCRGWDQQLRYYKQVSYDAQVFDFCMDGNVSGLQQLFERGQASPFEVDPDRRTPLHAS